MDLEDKTQTELLLALIGSAIRIGPWVSASLIDLQEGQEGHDGKYEAEAENFLTVVLELEKRGFVG